MRRLIVTTALAGSLVLAPRRSPSSRPSASKFYGVTSEHAVNGYKPTVTFTAPAGGRTLTNFVFQTLGCFGTGQFPVGVDPFAAAPWRVAKIPVAKTGVYSAKVNATSTALDAGTLTATISGSFTSATEVTGKITFSQHAERRRLRATDGEVPRHDRPPTSLGP